jgi:hypothetical protein
MLARTPRLAPTPVLYSYPILPFIADACTPLYFPDMTLSRSTSQKAKRCLDLPYEPLQPSLWLWMECLATDASTLGLADWDAPSRLRFTQPLVPRRTSHQIVWQK